jgi:nucleoside-diphosphate-sugar epimerase
MAEQSRPNGAGRRLLVTGTGGFIAPHVVEAFLRRGYAVFGLDKRPASPLAPSALQHRVCDLLDREATCRALTEIRPEIVIHMAARTDLAETGDIRGYAANIEGVESLLAAMRAAGSVRRAICTSSQLVHRVGYAPSHDEDYDPGTLYGQSKVQTERLWRAADGAGTEWCIVRPTTIWGPGMNPHYFTFFRMLRAGRYRHVGGGPTLKSYGYVGNSAEQLVSLAEAPPATIHRRVFYIADYEPIALQAWAEAFRRELGGPPIRTIPLIIAKIVARIGDALNALGARRFPFNSFRLNNVVTPYRAPVEPMRAVCATLPFSMTEGVAVTASWLRTVLTDGRQPDARG